jgi:hypothetical protein
MTLSKMPSNLVRKLPRFFIDMDGVLVNLDKEIDEVFGPRTTKTSDADWAELYAAKPNMFLEAEPMADALKLWNYVTFYEDVRILTAIPRRMQWPNSTTHKRQWIQKHLNLRDDWVLFGPYAEDKQFHCPLGYSHYVLIDDSELNIPQWRSRGGTAILHTSAADTIKQLKELGW